MNKVAKVNHFTICPNEFTYCRPICMYEKDISIPGLDENYHISIECPGYSFSIYHTIKPNILSIRIPVKPTSILRLRIEIS